MLKYVFTLYQNDERETVGQVSFGRSYQQSQSIIHKVEFYVQHRGNLDLVALQIYSKKSKILHIAEIHHMWKY